MPLRPEDLVHDLSTPAWPASAPSPAPKPPGDTATPAKPSKSTRWPPATRPCTTPTSSETVFAAVMADRADWEQATRHQRHLAAAADAELRRRHPGQHFPPLRSAEREPATDTQRDELTLTAGEKSGEMGQWIKDLAAGHRTFAERLADRQSVTVSSQDPDYGDIGLAFPAWTGPARDAILQPPKPEIPPSPQILQRMMERDADWEAAD